MHRICAGIHTGLNNFIYGQVALRRGRGTYRHSLIGHLHMQCIAVGIGVDRHCGYTHFFCGGEDPAGNFAAVGHQNFLKHRALSLSAMTEKGYALSYSLSFPGVS